MTDTPESTTTSWRYDPDRWPFLTADLPGTAGRIRTEYADFQVDEVPSRAPEGTGEHLHVRIRKEDLTTRYVIDHFRRSLGVGPEAMGHAGMKDRRAIATQWISIPAACEAQLATMPPLPGLTILETARTTTKLQEGDLAGNRFVIRVREAPGQADAARAIMAALAVKGVPNYYGPQRFGGEGDNAARGLVALRTGRKPRGWLDKLRTQSVQSWLFNDWIAARLAAGTFDTVILGDVAVKHETNGKFLVGEVEPELGRAAAFEISATGPLFGRKYHEAKEEARAIEDVILAAADITRDAFRPLPGTRRPIRMPLADWSVEPAEDGYVVSFFLPSGGYATAVLREVMKIEPEPMTTESEAPKSENEEASSEEDPAIA